MLTLDIYHTNQCLSLELPLPIEILAGELRAFHVEKPMHDITQENFTVTPTSELGEHFMRLVQPDDSLHRIATYSREFDLLYGDSQIALQDHIMADRFRDLNHMADYLQHGPAALTHLLRLRLGDAQVDLPCDDLTKHLAEAGFGRTPRQIRLNETDYLPLNEQGKQLLMKCSSYESLATTNLACSLLRLPGIDASMKEVMQSAHRLVPPLPTEPVSFICPLKVSVEDGDDRDLIEGDPDLLVEHEDEIRDVLKDILPDGKNMADFLDAGLKQKIASMEWDVSYIQGKLYGVIGCELRAPLTPDEQAELTDWITGQNSDGLGESFEQRTVNTEYYDLHVHLWHGGDDYFVMPSEDFFQQLHEQAQGFGGMEGMA